MQNGPTGNLGLRLPFRALRRLRGVGIFARAGASLEYQQLAKRYVVRGVESGGAIDNLGHYVTFCGEDGNAACVAPPSGWNRGKRRACARGCSCARAGRNVPSRPDLRPFDCTPGAGAAKQRKAADLASHHNLPRVRGIPSDQTGEASTGRKGVGNPSVLFARRRTLVGARSV